jgi:hypothetical protein
MTIKISISLLKENDYRSKFIRANRRSEGVKDVDHKPACFARIPPKAGSPKTKSLAGSLTHCKKTVKLIREEKVPDAPVQPCGRTKFYRKLKRVERTGRI